MKHYISRFGLQFFQFILTAKRNPFLIALVLVCLFCPYLLSQEGAAPADGTKPAQEISYLSWLIHVSGVIGIFIFALSFYFVAIAIKCFLELRTSVAAPPEVLDESMKLIEQKKGKELVQVLQADDSFYSEVLLAGMTELRLGLDEARERLERKSELLTNKMERSISILAVIGTLGPLIGLLGTLKGMISSFGEIARAGAVLDPSRVAEGISEALVITFEGVALSVPAIFLFSYFRNQISSISTSITLLADDQLRSIYRMLPPKV
jgi:biopolymer transport protein ExbB